MFRVLHLLFPSTTSLCYLIPSFPSLVFSALHILDLHKLMALVLRSFCSVVLCLCMPGSLCTLLTLYISHSNSPKENLPRSLHHVHTVGHCLLGSWARHLKGSGQLTEGRDLSLVQSAVASDKATQCKHGDLSERNIEKSDGVSLV